MSNVSAASSVNTQSYVNNYKSAAAKSFAADSAKETGTNESAAATFEKSDETKEPATYSNTTVSKADPKIVAQLKADADARISQMQSLVEKLIGGQGKANALAGGSDIWKFFADGDFSNVDDAAKAQAAKDIEEGGYWSVDETANRIVDFAKALVGDNASEDDINKMVDAFKKGFEEATKAWGKELPDISSQTYDKVLSNFDDWKKDAGIA